MERGPKGRVAASFGVQAQFTENPARGIGAPARPGQAVVRQSCGGPRPEFDEAGHERTVAGAAGVEDGKDVSRPGSFAGGKARPPIPIERDGGLDPLAGSDPERFQAALDVRRTVQDGQRRAQIDLGLRKEAVGAGGVLAEVLVGDRRGLDESRQRRAERNLKRLSPELPRREHRKDRSKARSRRGRHEQRIVVDEVRHVLGKGSGQQILGHPEAAVAEHDAKIQVRQPRTAHLAEFEHRAHLGAAPATIEKRGARAVVVGVPQAPGHPGQLPGPRPTDGARLGPPTEPGIPDLQGSVSHVFPKLPDPLHERVGDAEPADLLWGQGQSPPEIHQSPTRIGRPVVLDAARWQAGGHPSAELETDLRDPLKDAPKGVRKGGPLQLEALPLVDAFARLGLLQEQRQKEGARGPPEHVEGASEVGHDQVDRLEVLLERSDRRHRLERAVVVCGLGEPALAPHAVPDHRRRKRGLGCALDFTGKGDHRAVMHARIDREEPVVQGEQPLGRLPEAPASRHRPSDEADHVRVAEASGDKAVGEASVEKRGGDRGGSLPKVPLERVDRGLHRESLRQRSPLPPPGLPGPDRRYAGSPGREAAKDEVVEPFERLEGPGQIHRKGKLDRGRAAGLVKPLQDGFKPGPRYPRPLPLPSHRGMPIRDGIIDQAVEEPAKGHPREAGPDGGQASGPFRSRPPIPVKRRFRPRRPS